MNHPTCWRRDKVRLLPVRTSRKKKPSTALVIAKTKRANRWPDDHCKRLSLKVTSFWFVI